ncbi:hypothetical protein [Massilia sp. AB1]|uniref:hypothetical protein n=1 Tax=Massilia sp. AB1 TaxID=2823371 RepID=UPI001B82A155|nr:hypothetical protein [Massilia sp. AB1]MBQ5939634.1 hypothetical protein [Massilia sp. AB1]
MFVLTPPPQATSASVLRAPQLLWLLAIADTFGGLAQGFPVAQLLKSGVVAFFLIYLFASSALSVGTRLVWLGAIGYFVARLLVDYLIFLDQRVLSMQGGSTLRLLFFPLLYAYLLDQINKGRLRRAELLGCILVYGWLILASLFVGEVTGLGGVIGGRGTDMDGGKGFMIGANEVGLMLILTAPFVGADIVRHTRSLIIGAALQLLIYVLAGLHVFTKSSLISTAVSAFSVYRAFMRRGRAGRMFMFAVLAGLCIAITRLIYDNLETIETFARSTFFAALLDEGLVAFLFRGREEYISAIFPQLLEHSLNWLFLLFGAGEVYMRDLSVIPMMLAPDDGTTFEMDVFDMLGAYGLVGCAIYAGVVGMLLRQAGPRRFPAEISLAVFGILIHSFMAGHVLFSPQVTTLLALVLLYHCGTDPTTRARHGTAQQAEPSL